MITSAELTLLRQDDHNAKLPGIDTKTGDQSPLSSMTPLAGLPTRYGSYWYSPATNIVYVTKAGAVLNGINFGSATVQIMASNVTIENCAFIKTSGYYSITQGGGCSGAIVQNCTFDSQQATNLRLGAYISSTGPSITIKNNSFLNAPSDAVDVEGGTVTGNYFSGAGYDPLHPDAIWVTNSKGPTVISDNFIDWTTNANSTSPPNDCIRITDELGPVSNVTVTGNYLIGGSSGIDAGNGGGKDYSNINISGNYIGFGVNFTYAPGPEVGVANTNNTIVDFTNPVYSQTAWTAYQKTGLFTDGLATATADGQAVKASATQSTTLYGGGFSDHLYGSSQETIFVGGAGAQYMTGGSGKNIFSYLAISDSTLHNPDSISLNPTQDVIDLHSINANITGPQVNFTFIGSAAFSSAGGQVRVVQDVANNQTLVEADLVGDSSTDLEIRVAGLVNLTAANFALTTSQFIAATAQNTTMATFLSSQSLLDQVTGGYSIVDAGANVQANLAKLVGDATHIKAVTVTDGAFAASVATFTTDAALMDKFAGGVALVDAAANVQAGLGALQSDVGHIASISLGDAAAAPATLRLTSASAAADAAVLAKITSPYVVETSTSSGALDDVGHGDGLTMAIGAGNHTATGGGVSDTFVLAPHFGAATITDFGLYASNASLHDTISLSKTDFANWGALLASAHSSGGGANTTFTAQDGASLTLAGVQLYGVQHASAQFQADFKFS